MRRPRWGEGHGEEATMQGGHDGEDTMGRIRCGDVGMMGGGQGEATMGEGHRRAMVLD